MTEEESMTTDELVKLIKEFNPFETDGTIDLEAVEQAVLYIQASGYTRSELQPRFDENDQEQCLAYFIYDVIRYTRR